MTVCSFSECADWCAAHGFRTRHIAGFSVGPDPDLTEQDFRFTRFSIPDDAGGRVALAKNLIGVLDDSAELLVQISDWAVWPSGQHMPLFSRLREAFGDRRPLIEAPGQIVPPSEREDAVSILVLSVLYLWDCHVLSSTGDQALFVSHDQHGWVAVRGERSLESANQVLARINVLTVAGQ
jgi:hypothetical protein